MGKPKSPRPVADNEARAIARMLRVSPQKLNIVATLIRGKKVAVALADLEFSRRRISDQVRKTLQSAVANAENNHSLDVDALVVAEAFVGNSIKLKRFHARGRGKASRIERPYAHLTIIVREVASKVEAA
jgi:large subunit ribosomal protein L22